MDKLKPYLDLANMTPAAFARKAGLTRSHLHDLMSGRRKPSLKVAAAIERETDGLVPASSWVSGREESA